MPWNTLLAKTLIDVLNLNFKAKFSARLKVRKNDFCIALAEKQQKSRDRAPLTEQKGMKSVSISYSRNPSSKVLGTNYTPGQPLNSTCGG